MRRGHTTVGGSRGEAGSISAKLTLRLICSGAESSVRRMDCGGAGCSGEGLRRLLMGDSDCGPPTVAPRLTPLLASDHVAGVVPQGGDQAA